MCARSPQKFLSAEKVWWPLILRKRFPFLPLIKFIKFISFIPLWRFWCVVATNVDMWSQGRNAGTFKTLTTQMVSSNPIGSWTLNEDKIVRVQYCPYITMLSSDLPLFFLSFLLSFVYLFCLFISKILGDAGPTTQGWRSEEFLSQGRSDASAVLTDQVVQMKESLISSHYSWSY